MYFEETYEPRTGDYNRYTNLAYEAILQILENAGRHHAEQVNDLKSSGLDKKISWILAEWQIEVVRRPKITEALHLRTWVKGTAPTSAVLRDYLVFDGSGSLLIRAEAKFALFDLEAGRLMRIGKDIMELYQPESEDVFAEVQPRLRPPVEPGIRKPLVLRRGDIDFNGHVHNTRYLDLAMEALPDTLYINDTFREIRIAYRKPILEGNTVFADTQTIGDVTYVTLYAENVPCAIITFQ